MPDELEQFNAHQQDIRSRSITLVKAILLIDSGALSISIGIFVKNSSIKLSEFSSSILQVSWYALFLTIVMLITSQLVMLIRDYIFGERWRDARFYNKGKPKERRPWIELLIWGFGLVGYVLFIFGMLGLAFVASSAIDKV